MGGDGCCGEGEGEMLEEEALNWGVSMKWNEVKKWTEFSVKTRIWVSQGNKPFYRCFFSLCSM